MTGCEHCSAPFEPTSNSAGRFCCTACAYAWRRARTPMRTCVVCARAVPARAARSGVCSRRCGVERRRLATYGPEMPAPVAGARWVRASSGWALVDESDFAAVDAFSWSLDAQGYAHRMMRVGTGRRAPVKRVAMHRWLLSAPDGVEVDHVNGNRLDNRRANLRLATRAQNVANTGKLRGGTSRFKGVWRNAVSGRWQAMICVRGERRWLGSFDDEADAARAHDAAALAEHGDFARLNFAASTAEHGGC